MVKKSDYKKIRYEGYFTPEEEDFVLKNPYTSVDDLCVKFYMSDKCVKKNLEILKIRAMGFLYGVEYIPDKRANKPYYDIELQDLLSMDLYDFCIKYNRPLEEVKKKRASEKRRISRRKSLDKKNTNSLETTVEIEETVSEIEKKKKSEINRKK